MSIRMRHTKGHTRNRRSHHALKGVQVVKGEKGFTLPHRLDEATGTYRGVQIVTVKEKKTKQEKVKGPRTDAQHAHTHDHEHEHENAEQTRPRGFFGRVAAGLPKARRGAGGGGS